MADVTEERVVSALATGSKCGLFVGLALAAVATYFLLTPLSVSPGQTGKAFSCGSALQGPSSAFGEGICGTTGTAMLAKSLLFYALAIIAVIGGLVTFGTTTKLQKRRQPEPDADEEEENADGRGNDGSHGAHASEFGVHGGSRRDT